MPSDSGRNKRKADGWTGKRVLGVTGGRGRHTHPPLGTPRVAEPMSSGHGTPGKIAFALRKFNPSYLYQQFLILNHPVSSRESKD